MLPSKMLSVILSWSSVSRVLKIWFSIYSTYSAFVVNELLNFQKPFPRIDTPFNCKEKKISK